MSLETELRVAAAEIRDQLAAIVELLEKATMWCDESLVDVGDGLWDARRLAAAAADSLNQISE